MAKEPTFVPSPSTPPVGGAQDKLRPDLEVEKRDSARRASLGTNGKRKARNHRTLGIAIAASIFVADQLTKWVVTYVLGLQTQPGQLIELLPFFDLRWVENYGVSMGFLTASTETGRWLLVGLTAAISIGVAIWLWREPRKGDAIALSFILGGALGNIVDRVRYGYVVDFADLHFGEWRPFLIFNVADAAITIGVLLLLFRALLTRDTPPRKEK